MSAPARKTPREEAEAWVREYRETHGNPSDTDLMRAAWVLAADRPTHPLCIWAASRGGGGRP